MPSWVAIALLMESTNGWRNTDFTGRHPKTIRSTHRSITSAKAVKPSIVSPRARSRWRFPYVASESNRKNCAREIEPLQRLSPANHDAATTSCRRREWRVRTTIGIEQSPTCDPKEDFMAEPAPGIDFANLPAPDEGILVTLFITVRKVARSRDFYSRVLGGTVSMD